MKKLFTTCHFMGLLYTFAAAQSYVSHSYLGLKSAFGTLNNPYTNGSLVDVTERMGLTNMLEYGVEGMDKNVYVHFKTDFFGIIPDYIFKAVNKDNRKAIYGALMEEFKSTYNVVPQQYEFNASFTDFDVLAGNLSYGYKYIYAGGNFAWSNTSIGAYQSVSNIEIKNQEPANYYGFNERGNFSYGLNMILWNNNTKSPIRCIVAYDWMLMRDYTEKWQPGMGNRVMIDLQAKVPFFLLSKKYEEGKKRKRGLYVGFVFKQYDIDYTLSVNGVERVKNFTAGIYNFKIGYS